MCIAFFVFKRVPNIQLLLAFNRDEEFDRPTKPTHFWPDHPHILGGRDEVGGGTWLGITRAGRFAFLTNYRELPAPAMATTRGALTSDFLKGGMGPGEYLNNIKGEEFAGFNLVVGDLARGELWYLTNRGPPDLRCKPMRLEPGVYGLTNGVLWHPWHKAARGALLVERLLQQWTSSGVSRPSSGGISHATATAPTSPNSGSSNSNPAVCHGAAGRAEPPACKTCLGPGAIVVTAGAAAGGVVPPAAGTGAAHVHLGSEQLQPAEGQGQGQRPGQERQHGHGQGSGQERQQVQQELGGQQTQQQGGLAGRLQLHQQQQLGQVLEDEEEHGSRGDDPEIPWQQLFDEVLSDTHGLEDHTQLPQTGYPHTFEAAASSIFMRPYPMPSGSLFGTRSQTVLAVRTDDTRATASSRDYSCAGRQAGSHCDPGGGTGGGTATAAMGTAAAGMGHSPPVHAGTDAGAGPGAGSSHRPPPMGRAQLRERYLGPQGEWQWDASEFQLQA